ncbi:2998_t:CDS:1, partial [Acaulospora colombiana]
MSSGCQMRPAWAGLGVKARPAIWRARTCRGVATRSASMQEWPHSRRETFHAAFQFGCMPTKVPIVHFS